MHKFIGKPITTEEFYRLPPREVFSREMTRPNLPPSEHANRHILFRKRFSLARMPKRALLKISADDHFLLYLNGRFVAEGPAPANHLRQKYMTLDVTPFLTNGENLIAVHTYYQGLINRVWQSGDDRHYLLCELAADGEVILASDESFLYAYHSGYHALGTVGYDTGFRARFDCRADEIGFEMPDFDDSHWQNAKISEVFDGTLQNEENEALIYEEIAPTKIQKEGARIFLDFGAMYVGRLSLTVSSNAGSLVTIRMGQELLPDGAVRHKLRANCEYEEEMILSKGDSRYTPYDYFAFRYAEVYRPEGALLKNAVLTARHYPFTLCAALKPAYRQSKLESVWAMSVHTQKYGIQEAPLDCMEREKGFYLGDGCYTSLTHMLLTGRDTMVRKLIDDAFASAFITDTLMCCLNASFMQEIAEFPLILCRLVLWHYRYTHDLHYLKTNYPKVKALLDAYRRDYEKDNLLSELDKWCVVEWPPNFRDGYDVDLTAGKICHEAHAVMNAYYINAVRAANLMANSLGVAPYREEQPLLEAYWGAFYRPDRLGFCDSASSTHTSFLSDLFAYAFGLCPDPASESAILARIKEKKISSLSLFGAFVMLEGLVRHGEEELLTDMLLDEGAWLRMLREGATATFESWGKDLKWNTSLFHTTFSYAAIFLADQDIDTVFKD
ncbi:MAG: family 78 glycoside hydrolase catalytic domain [Clostridia bacterium]|nr:family 78 glycoside hydrolase catalytic domain [Clostridia bacterium]